MSETQSKRGLGRGLSALIPEADMEFLLRVASDDVAVLPIRENASDTNGEVSNSKFSVDSEALPVLWLNPEDIQPNPFQPRRTFSAQEMEELAASVKEHGILQPILVRPAENSVTNKAYELVAGERRWRAAQAAGLESIPVIVRKVSDQQALELALIENVQRHDISPLDAALAYRRLAEEFSLSQDDIAKRVGKSRSAIANTIRLLELPTEVQKTIEDGVLTEGHGRAILLAHGEGARRAVFRRALREGLSVRATEALARKRAEDDSGGESRGVPDGRAKGKSRSSEERAIEEQLQKQLKMRVKLQARVKGGQLIIEYFSEEDLQKLLALLSRQ